MPLYEYKCPKCGAVFEVLQKLSDSPIKKCISCGEEVHKIMSSPAIQFKGTGWYITDYANKNKKEPSSQKKSPPEVKSKEKTQAKSTDNSHPRQKE